MLKHRGYLGEAHWGSSYAVVPTKPIKHEKYRKIKKTSRKIRPEEEWYTIPIPAIIDKTLFEQAARQLEINFATSRRNKKNEYLLVNKIWCTCGNRRCGEGPQQGKHLYYRCNSRVTNFPLPSPCQEKGINARIADAVVWDKISELMSSPELIRQQAERYLNEKTANNNKGNIDVKVLEENIEQLKLEADRYNKAYGAGVFTIAQLADYVSPIREKIASLEKQVVINRAEQEKASFRLPHSDQIEAFTIGAREMLSNLNFWQKRGIVLQVVDKIISSKEEINVIGHIPIPEAGCTTVFTPFDEIRNEIKASSILENVGQSSIHRYSLDTAHNSPGSIPFTLRISMNLSGRSKKGPLDNNIKEGI
jgi:site-specific DNA recombinase